MNAAITTEASNLKTIGDTADWDAKETERRIRRESERRMAESKLKLEEVCEKWRNGERIYRWLYDVPVMLRIKGDSIETSKGATVPVSHARRGLLFVRQVVASGQEYVRNGHTLHLGHYAIDRIEPDGTLYAGCHVISYQEIERIAPQLEQQPGE